ncbi:MAG: hypothetical protein LBC02_07195 [Planctomycetaceae bacterium]|jgi:hypothetical protein|nr:hypothetical protein [Planctomycetaceae bacterium]
MKLLKNREFLIHGFIYVQHERIVLGLFHAVTALSLRSRLPCFGLQQRRNKLIVTVKNTACATIHYSL